MANSSLGNRNIKKRADGRKAKTFIGDSHPAVLGATNSPDGLRQRCVDMYDEMLTMMEQSINYRKHIEKIWSFKIEGTVPTKKNSYRRAKNKRMYKPEEVVQWEEDAIHQLTTFFNIPEKPLEKVYIKIHLYFGNNRRTDPDGKLTSILDILQKADIIKDDRWQCVPHFETSSSFREKNPGAYIIIGELK